MLLAAAVCAGGPCSGKATAKLTLTPRKGRKRAYTFTIAKSLKLADGGATVLQAQAQAARTGGGSAPRARRRSRSRSPTARGG